MQMEGRRDSMLETARLCFTSAARCEGDGDEEEWLIHYMLGKVAEKQRQPPTVYLQHYRQAAHYLHEEAARYPKKIHYHNPPELAMEALEVVAGPGEGVQGGKGRRGAGVRVRRVGCGCQGGPEVGQGGLRCSPCLVPLGRCPQYPQ